MAYVKTLLGIVNSTDSLSFPVTFNLLTTIDFRAWRTQFSVLCSYCVWWYHSAHFIFWLLWCMSQEQIYANDGKSDIIVIVGHTNNV